MQISLILKVKIDLLWIAVIAEFRFIRLLMKTETVKVTEIVEITMMILASEKWLFEMVMILSLAGTVLAAAMIWG